MKSLNDQASWIEAEIPFQKRKYSRWLKQKRCHPKTAEYHLHNLESIRETLTKLKQLRDYLDAETGDESEFELAKRGDAISNMIMEICQLGPEKVEDDDA